MDASVAAHRVFLFPGQSSVRPDAITRARRAHPAAEATARAAADVLGSGDAAAWLGPRDARIESNRDVQLVVFLATQMYLAALSAEGIEADSSMGLSLGEYSHLVHIGALTFADALRLVSQRGHCFNTAPKGSMVTVLAVEHEAVAEVVDRASAHGTIVISNYNAPTQHVIAGTPGAVGWAAFTLEDEFGAHTTVIENRVAMHSPLMQGPARAFAPALASARWCSTAHAYRPNVTGQVIAEPRDRDFIDLLTRHVAEPVHWRTSVDDAAACHPDATFVEVGPGCVLHNMLARSWRSLSRARTDDPENGDPATHFAQTVAALHAVANR